MLQKCTWQQHVLVFNAPGSRTFMGLFFLSQSGARTCSKIFYLQQRINLQQICFCIKPVLKKVVKGRLVCDLGDVKFYIYMQFLCIVRWKTNTCQSIPICFQIFFFATEGHAINQLSVMLFPVIWQAFCSFFYLIGV